MDIPGKRRKGWSNLRSKVACKRDVTQAGLKENNATNRPEWRKKLIMQLYRRPQITRQARNEEEKQALVLALTNGHPLILRRFVEQGCSDQTPQQYDCCRHHEDE